MRPFAVALLALSLSCGRTQLMEEPKNHGTPVAVITPNDLTVGLRAQVSLSGASSFDPDLAVTGP